MNTQILILIFACIQVAVLTNVPFNECGEAGTIKVVDVTPCDSQPCPLKRGSNVTITVHFGSEMDSNTAKVSVHGIINGVEIPWNIPQPDGCQSGCTCPIKKGSMQTYVTTIPISKLYPSLALLVKFELKGDSSDLFCFVMPVQVV